MAVSFGKATLRELKTVYTVEDVFNLVEVSLVDAHNARLAAEHAERERRRRARND